MLKFAANLTVLFNEVSFLDRFERAAKAGFDAVECLFPYEFDAADVAERLERHDLRLVLINMPAGNWAAGDRGTSALPERRDEFRRSIDKALAYALVVNCKQIHAMSGIVPPDADRVACEQTFLENIRYAAERASADGVTILIEALNDRDVPGYFVAHQQDAMELVRRVDRPNVAVQLDYYHAQIMDGDVTRLTERMAGRFAHVQIASVPDRHEPDDGELNYRYIFKTLERTGYDGWIGCEYVPRGVTEEGLGWMEAMRTIDDVPDRR